MAGEFVLSVGQLNEYVRRQLAADPMLRAIKLRGEISGYKRHFSGHHYFALKDEQARVNCVLFKQYAGSLDFAPKDGMSVVVTGSVSLFVRDGAYQVYCESIRREGAGELYLRFEALKQKLMDEGLFDPARKKPLPLRPSAIGVVTSRTGAVLRDIVRVARRRDRYVDILLSPASVQGEGAAEEIAAALDLINAAGGVDVILVGRGGGSMEDLWAFNEEVVARAIARSKIPVVSCVGHETDFTIADFVADLRAPTPSAAAEMAVPAREELMMAVDALVDRMDRALSGRMALLNARLNRLKNSPALLMPEKMLFGEKRGALRALLGRMDASAVRAAETRANRLALLARALSALNPGAVIGRGYAVVRRGGAVMADAAALAVGDALEIAMRDGTVSANVEKRTVR